jgi:formate--tetrahydrofolate ligase
VESANDLLAAMIDDALMRRLLDLDPRSITWRRVIDMDDRALRHIVVGLERRANGVLRETGFDITAASEVMAVLGLSTDLNDLRHRLGSIVVGFGEDGKAVNAEQLHAAGAMAVLLREALKPNLLQTCKGTQLSCTQGHSAISPTETPRP